VGNHRYYSDIVSNGYGYDLRLSPLYFLYGGFIDSGSLNHVGLDGYKWSSTAYTDAFTYYLSFDANIINPSDGYWYYFGFSIRCLAR